MTCAFDCYCSFALYYLGCSAENRKGGCVAWTRKLYEYPRPEPVWRFRILTISKYDHGDESR
jgi:hypothetical protein